MADQTRPRIIETVTIPQLPTPPTSRELRTQSVHRLQVGLFGLFAMLLLVGLANIIMDRAMLSDSGDKATEQVIAADAAPKKPATDPLADIGVVPSSDPPPAPKGQVTGDPLGAQ